MAKRITPQASLYFISYAGTMQGTKIEKAIKDFCRETFDHHICSDRGAIYIYGKIIELASELHNKWKGTVAPVIEYDRAHMRIRLKQKNAQDNFQLLTFTKIPGAWLASDEEIF